jgi:FKBP-type peptidyl-prolyl cis-trans isomerase 2
MKVGEKKNIRLEPKDAYGEEYIEETMSLSEYKNTMTQSIPVNALTGKLEQTVSKSQAENMFSSLVIGTEKKIGEANLKIISISGDNVIISIDDPKAPFYGKTLSV